MCGGVHYGEVEGLVSVERWSCRWVLPFLATKSAVLSTMSGHCQGEDSASRRGMERRKTVNITQEIMYYRTHISRLSRPLILDATHR